MHPMLPGRFSDPTSRRDDGVRIVSSFPICIQLLSLFFPVKLSREWRSGGGDEGESRRIEGCFSGGREKLTLAGMPI